MLRSLLPALARALAGGEAAACASRAASAAGGRRAGAAAFHASAAHRHGGSSSDEEGAETIAVTFVCEKDGSEVTVAAPIGKNLLEVAHANDVELEGACEASLACSTCHVVVEDEEAFHKIPEPTEDELDMLDLAFGLTETSRLGCQVIAAKELDGLRVRIPAATRNFYVDGHLAPRSACVGRPAGSRSAPWPRSQRAAAAGAAGSPRPAPGAAAAAAPGATAVETPTPWPGVVEGYWTWRGHRIRYQRCGDAGEPVLLVHGFGGNADHWRKNTPVLGKQFRAYAIDLLGYGFSDKPDPRAAPRNSLYNFDTWGDQLTDFTEQVIGGPAWLSCNSVGGLAGLTAGIRRPDLVRGVQLLNISLRGLHVERQAPWQRPLVAAFQRLLQETPLGAAFFGSVATPATVRSILRQAYADGAAVTDELVDVILRPGLTPGAVAVFLDFIGFSGGPLPEQLLAATPAGVPVSILWGAADPWEDMAEGRRLFASQPCVTEFVELPGVGHCPMDEAPDLVNPLIAAFIANTSPASSGDGGGGAARLS
ncbi:MFDX1 [Scenedesmus sp. PABB004]|nr:MFDX1 [Scenedesmus sp. PABB004]